MVVASTAIPPLVREARGIQPRHYQSLGTQFLWEKKRAMLTDAPGLGKTPQAALAAQVPCLVVCPNYLVKQWGDWLQEHLPSRKTVTARGDRYRKLSAIQNTTADFIVINVEMLRTHYDELVEIATAGRWETVIFDESHHLRNKGATQSMAAVVIAHQIPRCYELTATPIWKDPDDLFMQLRILQPTVFTSYFDFVDMFLAHDDTQWGTKVYGVLPDKKAELDSLLDMMRIGRNYKDAGRELPPIIQKNLILDFNEAQQKIYDQARDAWLILGLNEIMTNYMKVMHTLRMMTFCEQKIEAVVNAATEDNKPCVVFTWYVEAALELTKRINAVNKDSAVCITGEFVKVDDRPKLANGTKTVVCTISSLSEGVDLSWARTVIYAEENWPPGSLTQSLARVARERQIEYLDSPSLWDEVLAQLDSRQANAEPIQVYFIQMKGTIDQVVHATSQRRGATIRDVLAESIGF